MITKSEYKNSLKIVKQYEKENEKVFWSCETCVKQVPTKFDKLVCIGGFDLKLTCKGKKYKKIPVFDVRPDVL